MQSVANIFTLCLRQFRQALLLLSLIAPVVVLLLPVDWTSVNAAVALLTEPTRRRFSEGWVAGVSAKCWTVPVIDLIPCSNDVLALAAESTEG